jgi:hypothetical protein
VLAAVPVVGLFWAATALVNARRLDLLALQGLALRGGDAMEASLNAVWDSRLGFVVPTLGWHVLGSQFGKSMAEGRRARSDIAMTGTRESNQSDCYRGESSEFIFSRRPRTTSTSWPRYCQRPQAMTKAGTFQSGSVLRLGLCSPCTTGREPWSSLLKPRR